MAIQVRVWGAFLCLCALTVPGVRCHQPTSIPREDENEQREDITRCLAAMCEGKTTPQGRLKCALYNCGVKANLMLTQLDSDDMRSVSGNKRWLDSSHFEKKWIDASSFEKKSTNKAQDSKRWLDSSHFQKKWLDSAHFKKRDSFHPPLVQNNWASSSDLDAKSLNDNDNDGNKEKKWIDASHVLKKKDDEIIQGDKILPDDADSNQDDEPLQSNQWKDNSLSDKKRSSAISKRWVDDVQYGPEKRWIDSHLADLKRSNSHVDMADKKWLDSSHFAKKWLDSSHFAKKWLDSSHFAKKWLDSSHFDKKWLDSSHFDKKWLDSSHFDKKLADSFEKKWLDPSHFTKKWLDTAQFQKKWLDSAQFRKKWLDPSQFQKKWLDSAQFQKKWLDSSHFQKRWLDSVQYDGMKRTATTAKGWDEPLAMETDKKWLDLSQMKRVVDDEDCNVSDCESLEGQEAQRCLEFCGEKKKRKKRWVDSLSYGEDNKRSAYLRFSQCYMSYCAETSKKFKYLSATCLRKCAPNLIK